MTALAIAYVVCDQKGADPIQCHADRASPRITFLVHEAGENIERWSSGPPMGEWNENDLVSTEGAAIPRAMLPNESAAGISRGHDARF